MRPPKGGRGRPCWGSSHRPPPVLCLPLKRLRGRRSGRGVGGAAGAGSYRGACRGRQGARGSRLPSPSQRSGSGAKATTSALSMLPEPAEAAEWERRRSAASFAGRSEGGGEGSAGASPASPGSFQAAEESPEGLPFLPSPAQAPPEQPLLGRSPQASLPLTRMGLTPE